MAVCDDFDQQTRSVRCDVLLEQTLGHVTHGMNLRRLLPTVDGVELRFIDIPFEMTGAMRHLPLHRNWTVRAGMRARSVVRSRRGEHDALFVHTQVPAVLLGKIMTEVPTIVSVDATPLQYDSLGAHYDHSPGWSFTERLKTELNRRCFDRASRIVAWSNWAKGGLVADYEVDPNKVTVIPPGVDTELWARSSDADPDGQQEDNITRVLFVGGDFRRKGGFDLLQAFASVRSSYGTKVELHLVTPAPLEPADGVSVYPDVTPNSSRLVDLYRHCDVFCLPTHGDCLPMVLPEAGAAGLAMIATEVGAIREVVRHEETGLLIPVGDVEALADALDRLVADEELRSSLARAGARLIATEHDAATNASLIGSLIRTAAAD